MKRVRLLLVLVTHLYAYNASSQTILWTENFNSYSDGTTVGGNNNTANPAADWTLTCSCGPSATFWKETAPWTGDEYIEAINLDGIGTWTSEAIDISGSGLAVAQLNIGILSISGSDYARAYYYLDGGPRQLFFEATSLLASDDPATVILQGSSVVLEVEFYNDESYDIFRLDDVFVTEITNLYSRQNGNIYTSGTWSADSYGGASCGCTPTPQSLINVGLGHNVTATSDAIVAGAIIEGGASFSINGAYDFTINYGSTLDIASGSVFTTTNSGSAIIFNSQSAYTFQADGELSIGDVYIGDNQTLLIQGTGFVDVEDDMILESNASVTNSMSALNILNQLEFDNGSSNASFTNNGTMSITNNLSFDNDDCDVINTGVMTIGGNIFVENADNGFFDPSDDNNSITNSGTLTFDAVELNEGNFVILNSGTINQNGVFIDGEIDDESSFTNQSNAVWNYYSTSTSVDGDMSTVLNASATNNSFNYLASGNQRIIGTTYYNLNLLSSGVKRTEGNLDINGNLTIDGTARLNVNPGNDNITIAGNWIVTSTHGNVFNEGTETVTFDGTGVQTITHPSSETFYNLTLAKTSGSVDMAVPVTVNGTMNFQIGLIYPNSHDLTINGSVSNGSAASYAVTDDTGSLVQTDIGSGGRTGNILFPVGSQNADYTPVTINNAGTADDFTVQVKNNVYENGGTSGTQLITAVVHKTWFIDESSSGGTNATLTFQWNGSNQAGDFDPLDVLVSHHDGTIWDPVAEGLTAAGGDPYTVAAANVSTFSPFAVGSSASALPVELVNFTAVLNNGVVDIDWETATELNNDYFTIEKSVDFNNFTVVGTINGQGTKLSSTSYSHTDTKPYNGVSYYRLKQTDLDGTFVYFPPVRVDNFLEEVVLDLYPVPGDGKSINLRLHGIDADVKTNLRIIDLLGNVVYASEVEIDHSYGMNAKIEFLTPLSAGLYTLMLDLPEPILRRFVVE